MVAGAFTRAAIQALLKKGIKSIPHPYTGKKVWLSQYPKGISGIRAKQLHQTKQIDDFIDEKLAEGPIRQQGRELQKEIKDKFDIDIELGNLSTRVRWKQGAQKAAPSTGEVLQPGTPLGKEVENWLKVDDRYKKLTAPKVIDQMPVLQELMKKYGSSPWYKENLQKRINTLRKKLDLGKERYKESPIGSAEDIFDNKWRSHLSQSQYPRLREMGKKQGEGYMDAADMARYREDFKTALTSGRGGVEGLGKFTDDEIKAAMNVVEDTIALGRDKPMHMFGADLDYAPYTAFKQGIISLTDRNLAPYRGMPNFYKRYRPDLIQTVGHSQKTSYQRPFGMGAEMSRIEQESHRLNTAKLALQKKAQESIDKGDIRALEYYHNELKKLGLRAEMEMETGFPLFIGRGALPGKYAKGGVVNGYAAGGIGKLGINILKKLAKKMPEEDFLRVMETLWKGVDPKRSGRYKAWAKNRWSPGYKWPYQKSRIKGPEGSPRKHGEPTPRLTSHMADLSPGERVELQSKYADDIWEYKMKKKLGRDLYEDLEYPFLNPENDAFISTAPRTGLGRYQLRHFVDPENVGPIDKYQVYDWWDDILNRMRKKPKFKYVKDARGNIVLKEVK